MKEFSRIYRPTKLEQVVGQPDAVRMLSKWIKADDVPHAICFHGPSGCGKTTLARILRRELGCNPKYDFTELNCADTRGIDTIREMRRGSNLGAIGKCRVWLLDEAHKLSNDAQNALLKILEDPPATAYYVLCTTDPGKLIKTIQNRCSQVPVRSLSHKEVLSLLRYVMQLAKLLVTSEVLERIAESAEGSARKALTILHQIAGMGDEKDQLSAIARSDHRTEAYQIFRALIDTRTRWPDMAKILSECDLEDSEGIRHLVLACCSMALLRGKPSPRAAMVIDYFRDHFYDSKKAGLIHACYEVVGAK